MSVEISPMADKHAAAVLAIYRAGLEGGDATFETAAPSWPDFRRAHLAEHSYVGLLAGGSPDGWVVGRVAGWVSATPVSDRCVYAGVVEHSVYVDPVVWGRGIGRALLQALIASTEAAGIWTIQAGIFPENQASVALHAGVGFRVVGRRERIGRQRGRWRDVLLMERRSSKIG
ncbi:MAG: GNAT family N-acetyltransferase [Jatrophihabitantaceae bacterium]